MKNKGLNISTRSFVTAIIVIFALMTASYALTLVIPGGAYRNLDYVQPYFRAEPGVPQWCIDLMADPQTAGGLLVAMPPDKAQAVVDMLKDEFPWVAIVGEVIEKQDVEVILK